jgi:hypothetical protein
VEADLGDFEQALLRLDRAIESLYVAGNVGDLASRLARLTVALDHVKRLDIAATIFGACTRYTNIVMITDLPVIVEHLQTELGEIQFDDRVAVGASLELTEAVHYARRQIALVRRELAEFP